MVNDPKNVNPKQYKISDPEIISAILWLIPLFFIFLAKYVFINNAMVQKYLSGFPQFLLLILWFVTAWLVEKRIQKKKTDK
jgi:positive regulator of sigma E activity